MDIAAVVGLGNPGREYEATRHNIGFHVVDVLAAKWRVPPFSFGHHVAWSRRGGSRPIWLVKPQDYMNLSGPAVAAFAAAESLLPSELLVVVDDVELPLGQLRLRRAGGAGTHNGLRSLVETFGENFPRLRLGIGGATRGEDLASYVLSPFAAEELQVVRAMLDDAVACIEMVLHVGLERAANRYNRPLVRPARAPEEAQ